MNENKGGEMRWPDFFLIGAAKSGTSSVHRYLRRHPRIFMPGLKEPEYYSDDSVYARGGGWYTDLFSMATKEQLCGEASTTYSRFPHTPDVPSRIKEDIPNAKFIYIMRHPIERAYSHYCHHMREGVTMTFEEALEKQSIYVDCSKYIDQIRHYLCYFKEDNFLFLFFDDLRSSPRDFFYAVEEFLDVDTLDLTKQGIIYSNTTGADHFLRRHTTRKIRDISFFNTIADITPQKAKDIIFRIVKASSHGKELKAQFKIPVMKSSTRDYLLDFFYEYNNELERFLGRSLPDWGSYEIKPILFK